MAKITGIAYCVIALCATATVLFVGYKLKLHKGGAAMRLKIELPQGWVQHPNASGPATFSRHQGTGALQVSWAEYRGQQPPKNTTEKDLEQMATTFGRNKLSGEFIESSAGSCAYGQFGTSVFRSAQHPRMQVWFITDGMNFIMATHICEKEPDLAEISEAQIIARGLWLDRES